jgi:hypothetical protein
LTIVGRNGRNGIWVARGVEQPGQDLDESDDEGSGDEASVEEIESADEESESESDDETQVGEDDDYQDVDMKSSTVGRFGILAMDD